VAKSNGASLPNHPVLHVLIAEDSFPDAELMVAVLKRGGFSLSFEVVDEPAPFERALADMNPDLILSDHNLRTWTGFDALAGLKKSGKDIPFLVVTATLGDEAAVEYIKQGAADYVLKHRLERLPVAARQALRDKAHRLESARLHEQILSAKREWELTFDGVSDPIMVVDAGSAIVRANRATCEMAGKPFVEIIGGRCMEVARCRDEEDGRCPLDLALETGHATSRDFFQSLSGRWFECAVSPRSDPDGSLKGGVVVLHDFTERQKAEIASRQLAAIVESSEDAIIGKTLEGVIQTWNRGAEKLYGYTREEAVGQPVSMLAPPDAGEEFPRILEGVRRGETGSPYETVRRRKDGSSVPVSVTVSPVLGPHEEVVGASTITRDITERKQAEKALRHHEEQLRQASKMEAIGRLAGGVAHDFNNLLTIINGYVQLILEQCPAEHPNHAQLEQVLKAGERAATLTRQLLAFGRRQVLAPQVLDLNEIVRNTSMMLRRLIGEDIELAIVQHTSLGRVRADPGQIEQVLMNLAVNARDAMPQGGKLTLETANVELDENCARSHAGVAPGRYVMLAVGDTGCGMDAQTQSHIFEPFYTTKGQGKGTGLGLSTVYGIVRQSGGHVNVYSELGRGTIFKVFLPRVDEPVEARSRPIGPEAPMSGTETVLLVEDESGVRSLAREALQANGYTVLEAAGSEEALALTTRHPGGIHLLLTDVIMPGMNGKELADRLGGLRPGIKVLFFSGYTADAIAQHGILKEGVAFLPKPFTPRELLARVRRTLDA
jgi:PAS domain S-box-containing protein